MVMKGSQLRGKSATDHHYTPAQRDLRLNFFPFNGTRGVIVILGSVSDLDLGVWPTNAYVQIGMRTKKQLGLIQTSNGVWLIFTPTPTQYKIEMQDISGVSFEPVYFDKTIGIYHYRIVLTPNGPDFAGTAYAEIWTAEDESDKQITGTIKYGQDQFGQEKVEDFRRAHLFYALLASADAAKVKTFSARVRDIKTNIPAD